MNIIFKFTSPVKGSEILQYNVFSFPEIQNLGTLVLSLAFCNNSGIILKVSTLLGSLSILEGTLSSTINSNVLLTSFAKKFRFISQRIRYCIFTKTPWYVSYKDLVPLGFNGNSNGISVFPLGILPLGAASKVYCTSCIG